MQLTCTHCGKQINTNPHQVVEISFCGDGCFNAYHSRPEHREHHQLVFGIDLDAASTGGSGSVFETLGKHD